MTTAERINETLRRLPVAFQQEVLDFVETLARKQARAERDWNGFSLDQAMRGLEDDEENGTVNGHSDEDLNLELMRQAMADPQFVADLEEVSEDFQYVDADEVVS